MESFCPCHKQTFEELERIAPNAPFLALGQTAFWDEPMKAAVALCSKELGYSRRFTAGIHDTDYFAKHPGSGAPNRYFALPHNDTTTKELWSAAGEFSSLLGSETVVTREQFHKSGTKLKKVQAERARVLDPMTEAYGWRGVVFGGDNPPIIAETPNRQAGPVLLQTLDWAIEETLALLPHCQAEESRKAAERLKEIVCKAHCGDDVKSVGEFYRGVLPELYSFTAGKPVDIDTTATSELLRFNTETARKPRFKLPSIFISPKSRQMALNAYDDAVKGTEIYPHDRFGTWAIPFDLVIPGVGRGTLRIAPKAIIVMTPTPQFISLKKPITCIEDLAAAIEKKWGKNCTLVGKAVTLIGMLAAEYVFVFHEGASSYVKYTREFHKTLITSGQELTLNPILRIKYDTWSEWQHCDSWIKLPEPFRQPFGTDELSTASFAARWKSVSKEQEELLSQLGQLNRPIDLIQFLSLKFSQSWSELAEKYSQTTASLDVMRSQIEEYRIEKKAALQDWKSAKAQRSACEHAKGEHWRAKIFEKQPTEKDLEERKTLTADVHEAAARAHAALARWKAIQQKQDELTSSETVRKAHEARRDLELEAELMRMKLIRQAVTTVKGLSRAAYRPTAWWFPIVCPDGGWYEAVTQRASYYLEPLQ